MRKVLATLARVHSWQLQEAQRRLGAAVQALAGIDAEAERLEREIACEQACARGGPPETQQAYAAYAVAALQRRQRLAAARTAAEAEERTARDGLEDAFAACKRIDRLIATWEARAAARDKAREDARLEEVSGEMFRRARRAQPGGYHSPSARGRR